MKNDLKAGDRIRLKVRTIGGWKGRATVVDVIPGRLGDELVRFRKDGSTGFLSHHCYACRHEVSKIGVAR